MALYTPDLKYIKAKNIIENLTDSERDQLIKYYIEKHDEWHSEDKDKLEEYDKFFDKLNSFLPNKNRRYG